MLAKTLIKIAAASTVLVTSVSHAGTGGTEFQQVATQFEDWVEGYGGMALSLAAVGVGGVTSVAQRSPLPILTGIGSAIFLAYTPDAAKAIFTATI